MSDLYLDVLDNERKKIFERLSAFSKYGILAGGTALALQLGHRKSFDFDIFVPKPLFKHFFKKIVDIFGKSIKTRISTSDIIMIETSTKIEIHFVYVWFKRLFPTVKTNSLDLMAVGDIAADKAYTIGRRGEWRDYVDIFFLLKKNIYTLKNIINLAEKKYQPEFNPRLFLEQLTYYGDIRDFDIVLMKDKFSKEEIQQFLGERVKSCLTNTE